MVLRFTARTRPEWAAGDFISAFNGRPVTIIRDLNDSSYLFDYEVAFKGTPGYWSVHADEVREDEPGYTASPTHVRIYRDQQAPVDGWPWIMDAVDDFGNYTGEPWQFETYEQACAKITEFIDFCLDSYECSPRKRGGFSIHQ